MATLVTLADLRRFGLLVGAIFLAIGLWPVVRGRDVHVWAVGVGAVLFAAGVLWPAGLRPVHRGWIALSEVLGWINSRLILGVIFFGLITPMAAVWRLLGRDPMQRRFERSVDTYRVVRTPRPRLHMNRQF
jgi:hypothetical protein